MPIKKIAFFTFLILSFVIINGLLNSIYSLWQKQKLVSEATRELILQEQENTSLKKQLTVVNSKQFVEEEARDKLFLIKPGEGVIVMPQQVLQASSSGQTVAMVSLPNWEEWWSLFF
jgi:cell division protein FtsB